MKKIIIPVALSLFVIGTYSCNGNGSDKPADPTTNRTTPTVENTPSTPVVTTADSLHKHGDTIKRK